MEVGTFTQGWESNTRSVLVVRQARYLPWHLAGSQFFHWEWFLSSPACLWLGDKLLSAYHSHHSLSWAGQRLIYCKIQSLVPSVPAILFSWLLFRSVFFLTILFVCFSFVFVIWARISLCSPGLGLPILLPQFCMHATHTHNHNHNHPHPGILVLPSLLTQSGYMFRSLLRL